jgi:Tol biopolymer transport system component
MSVPASSNGSIAFVRTSEDAGADIYLMEPNGSDIRRITDHPDADVEPAWAPDGTRLAFTRADDTYPVYGEIYTVSSRGGNATRITSDFTEADSPTWSPDGTKLAFRGCCGDEIFVVELADAAVTQLSHEATDGASGAYRPAWSPTGTEIAYAGIRYDEATETDSEALYLTNLDGDGIRRLTPDFFFDGRMSWSPGGSRLAFAGRTAGDDVSDIYVVGADGSNLTRVMEGAVGPAWSPDGTKIAFSSTRDGDSEIYVMAPDGSDVTQLTHNALHDSDPAWQPVPVDDDQADQDPESPDCGVINVASDEYGTRLDTYEGRPGDVVTLSGTTQRGEDGRYAPSDRMEAWWNTDVPNHWRPLRDGPVERLLVERDTDACYFSEEFTVPDVEPGTYRISVLVWDEVPADGYGWFLPHDFEVLPTP